MAAFAAAASLKTTILHILQSSRISYIPSSSSMLKEAYIEMSFLQLLLLELDRTKCYKIRTEVNAWDERIKEIVWGFEDILENHLVDQILPQLESSRGGLSSFIVDLQILDPNIAIFIMIVVFLKVGYFTEMENMPEEEGEPISSRIDFGGINSNMVGLSAEYEEVRDYLLAKKEDNCCCCYAISGMAGVGKTTFAKKIFDDPLIQEHFNLRAWVKVGRKCERSELFRCILAQVDPNTYNNRQAQEEGDEYEKLVKFFGETCMGKRCLIVFDDVWGTDLMHCFPNVQILMTSRLGMILYNKTYDLRLLDEEESRQLLAEKVFGEKSFPSHLEEFGEEIADKCEGLPLMIVTLAELLSKEEKTPKYWNEVAKKRHKVFKDAYNQIAEVFYPSYDYLPQYLKICFLYLGAFPPYSDMDKRSLFNQLSAEGFLEPVAKQTSENILDDLEGFMVQCTEELARQYNILLLGLNPSESLFLKNEFRVHSCWQHLCKKEASKVKFLHVLESWDDDMKDQRRLCAHYNTLFAFKEVYDSIQSDCASTTRSLLCYGKYHQYPMPIHAMDFKLLRVLGCLKVRFYDIPLEFLKLVCLKYLALAYNKELPASISNLFQLQFLIILPHQYIKKRGILSYLPAEIWDMPELQHIQVLERELPTPTSDATLDKLSSLLGVSANSCTREILKRIPNLKELTLIIVLNPYDDDVDSNSLIGLSYISEELHKLQQLTYSIRNPELKQRFLLPLSMFPSSLRRLVLRGLGCPWRDMNGIGSMLPNLEKLKLEEYAFRGPEWDMEQGSFLKLQSLVIEDTDLVRWRPQHGSLPNLEFLSIRHCYKLQQLDWFPTVVKTCTIELFQCIPSAFFSAKQLRPESLFNVIFWSSFCDENSRLASLLG